jgi:addiction module HigA family antidote
MTMAKEYTAKEPALAPVHPGELLREDILPAAGLSVSAAARALRISRQTLHSVLARRQSVTPEMALRLGKLFGNGPALWLNMQQAYDLWRAQDKLAEIIEEIETVEAA